jgi:hypothetical protein
MSTTKFQFHPAKEPQATLVLYHLFLPHSPPQKDVTIINLPSFITTPSGRMPFMAMTGQLGAKTEANGNHALHPLQGGV